MSLNVRRPLPMHVIRLDPDKILQSVQLARGLLGDPLGRRITQTAMEFARDNPEGGFCPFCDGGEFADGGPCPLCGGCGQLRIVFSESRA